MRNHRAQEVDPSKCGGSRYEEGDAYGTKEVGSDKTMNVVVEKKCFEVLTENEEGEIDGERFQTFYVIEEASVQRGEVTGIEVVGKSEDDVFEEIQSSSYDPLGGNNDPDRLHPTEWCNMRGTTVGDIAVIEEGDSEIEIEAKELTCRYEDGELHGEVKFEERRPSGEQTDTLPHEDFEAIDENRNFIRWDVASRKV